MKVSIITTCYNSAKTIKETIESILSQSGDFSLEYIITDAGSTDGTLEIILSYGDKIKFFSVPGLNQSQGINYGLKQSTGEICAFLNSDDVYKPGAIASVTSAFQKNPNSRWLIGHCPIINEKGDLRDGWISRYKNFLLHRYAYWLLLIENFICQPAVFFHRELLNEVGYFSEKEHLVMDYDFWLRTGLKYKPIILRQDLACFRRFAGTKSNSNYLKQFKDDMQVAFKYAKASGLSWTMPLKYLSYLKTILVYRFLYR